ncbi:protein PFC0760c-like [Chelonus insularis]|uniref:protein PFC0760c-like n=1 Tax=Chelonus insularis TaxID=460826 RepID=UPI00158C366F|nr:protein PFC0760c-like [Chelonus insularis]XP_034951991.1 protein PFC0760c-like [Chelonus insularis]
MGECFDFNWQNIDNTLSKRMIDNSLIHLLDRVQKKMSKKTIIFNQKLKKLQRLKNYDQYIKIKTKIKEKLSNGTNEYESSNTESSSDEMNSDDAQDVEENKEKNEQSSQNRDEHDTLPKDKSNNLISENDVPQLTNNEEKNESGIDDNSIKDSISNYDNDSIRDNHSDMISDDEINKLVIDDDSTQELVNSYDNDDVVENHSNKMNEDEENELETHDNSTKDSITSPKNDNITENHNDTFCQKERPALKIIMTEIIKPKYTVIPNPQTILNPTEKLTHNQSSSDQLLSDNKSIELESSQRNNSPIQGSIENNINNENLNNLMNSGDSMMIKQRVKKNKTPRIKRKNIIIKNDNENSQSQCNKIPDHINDSDTNVETGKMSNIENSKSQNLLSIEKAALTYTLEHMAHVKHRQERLNNESQFLNDSYINIENESREDSMEQENNLLQSNVLTKRPMTLDEYVQENDLVPLDDKASAFTLNDLSEDDDLFLMEIPKSMINQELLGQKMVVRNFDMTIGSTNYKLRRLKNDTFTCILKENNERMSFKAVNIKPKATFVVTEILAPTNDDNYFHQGFEITHGPCPFPQNLKIRNPLENNNKRLKKYKRKMRQIKKRKLNEM